MKHDWITSIPYEVHLARAYRMPSGGVYVIVTRTVMTQPPYPCAVYHFDADHDWGYYIEEVYKTLLEEGQVMRDMFCSRDLLDVSNGIIPPHEDLGTCLYVIGEIVADGEVIGSRAFAIGGRWGRTDIGTWTKVEEVIFNE